MVARADLVRAAVRLGAGGLAAAAELMGYVREEAPASPSISVQPAVKAVASMPVMVLHEAARPGTVPFWRPVACEFTGEDKDRALAELVAREQAEARSVPRERGEQREPGSPALSAWRRLGPLLQRALTAELSGSAVDVPAVLRRCGRGEPIAWLPRRRCRGWTPTLVLVDRPFRLVPFWDDQRAIVQALRRAMGAQAVTVRVLADGPDSPTSDGAGHIASLRSPAHVGMPVLALGDLGWYGGREDQRGWLRLARELGRGGARLHALVPVPRARWSDPLARAWRAMPWERPSPADAAWLDVADREGRAQKLLTLLAPAMRIEPGLLRDVRRVLPRVQADVGTEADVWAHQDLTGMDPEATAIRTGRAGALRRAFVQAVDPTIQHRVLEELRTWHWNRRRAPEAWHVEVLALESARAEATGAALFDPAEIARAERFMVALTADLCDAPLSVERAEPVSRWYQFLKSQERGMWRAKTTAGRALQMLGMRLGDGDVPEADPRLYALATGGRSEEPCEYTVYQIGGGLEIGQPGRGSLISQLIAAESMVHLSRAGAPERLLRLSGRTLLAARPTKELVLRTDRQMVRLVPTFMPGWACAIGRDDRGLWAELKRHYELPVPGFHVRSAEKLMQHPVSPLFRDDPNVNLRMRWIPPDCSNARRSQRTTDFAQREAVWGTLISRGFWFSEVSIRQMLALESISPDDSILENLAHEINVAYTLNVAESSVKEEAFWISSSREKENARRSGVPVVDGMNHLVCGPCEEDLGVGAWERQ
jgi:hypothetical protein